MNRLKILLRICQETLVETELLPYYLKILVITLLIIIFVHWKSFRMNGYVGYDWLDNDVGWYIIKNDFNQNLYSIMKGSFAFMALDIWESFLSDIFYKELRRYVFLLLLLVFVTSESPAVEPFNAVQFLEEDLPLVSSNLTYVNDTTFNFFLYADGLNNLGV